MAMAETPEERQARLKAQLDKGRATAQANRAAKAAMPAHALILEHDEIEVIDPPIVAGEDHERRMRLLEGIDLAIADLISDAELDEIEAEERQKAEAERKKRALASVRESLRQKARVENSLIEASVLLSDEEKKRRSTPVKIRINLPANGDPARGANGFRVDGVLYQQGTVRTVPLAVAESLAEQHYRTWLAEIKFTTLDQRKRGNSAAELAGQKIPQFYVDA
jgi:hypothetical protein